MIKLCETKLRPLQESDLALILKWRNSDRIRQNMFHSGIISWQQHVAWFEHLQFREDQRVLLFLLSNNPLGVVNFTNINNRTENFCEWGFYIGCEEATKGSGLAMGILSLDFAFQKLGVHHIIGQCFIFNRASSNYHEKLGFVYRDDSNKLFERDGTIFNVKQYELTVNEWGDKRKQLYREIFLD